MTKITIPKYEDIIPSVQSHTAYSNMKINVDGLFDELPITHYEVISKKRGRKKKNAIPPPEMKLDYGSIVTIKNKQDIRGIDLKKKPEQKPDPELEKPKLEPNLDYELHDEPEQQPKKKSGWFRNSITIVVMFDKFINFKVYTNGTYQISGCKNLDDAFKCVKFIWSFMKDKPHLYNLKNNDKNFEALYVPVLSNINFDTGVYIDRIKLAKIIEKEIDGSKYILRKSGYIGINIKMPLDIPIEELETTKMIYNIKKDKFEIRQGLYKEYLDTLDKKELKKKKSKKRYISLLSFYTGKMIMSGITSKFVKPYYEKIAKILEENADDIVEKLDV